MKYQIRNKKVSQIQIGFEVGAHRVVWLTNFYDKQGVSISLFIGINHKSTYRLFISDSSRVLSRIKGKSKKLSTMILESLKIIKENCRMKHDNFDRKDNNLPEGRGRRN